jgi:acetyl-CoA carboxylase carboxyltransferase component
MNLEFNKNEDVLKQSLSEMRRRLEKIYEGGGKKAIEKQKEKNKLTPRERITYLIDNDKPFIEIGAFAGYDMYAEQGGCPAGGTVAGVGYVSGRQCVILANDQTVKAGAWFPITGCRRLLWKIICLLFIWLIAPVCFFHCKTIFFLIKNILGASFAIMPA